MGLPTSLFDCGDLTGVLCFSTLQFSVASGGRAIQGVEMAKGSGSAGGRSTSASRGSSPISTSASRSSNSRMWSQPATAKQIGALKANGNFDGKYYSKGRAGQSIGQSVRRFSGRTSDPGISRATQFHSPHRRSTHLTAQRTSPDSCAHRLGRRGPTGRRRLGRPQDHNIVLEEGTTMSQLAPIHRSTAGANITSVVALTDGAGRRRRRSPTSRSS